MRMRPDRKDGPSQATRSWQRLNPGAPTQAAEEPFRSTIADDAGLTFSTSLSVQMEGTKPRSKRRVEAMHEILQEHGHHENTPTPVQTKYYAAIPGANFVLTCSKVFETQHFDYGAEVFVDQGPEPNGMPDAGFSWGKKGDLDYKRTRTVDGYSRGHSSSYTFQFDSARGAQGSVHSINSEDDEVSYIYGGGLWSGTIQSSWLQ